MARGGVDVGDLEVAQLPGRRGAQQCQEADRGGGRGPGSLLDQALAVHEPVPRLPRGILAYAALG